MPLDFASPTELQQSWKFLDGAGDPPKSAIEAHAAIEAGLPSAMLKHFRALVDELSDSVWADLMAVSLTQFKRLKKEEKPLPVDVGSHMVMFAVILARAEDIFGDRTSALGWLTSEQMALSGRRPLDLLDTFIGAGLVERTLNQIDHGVYI